MADNFYAKYPASSGGGSGVSSLNSLTGALTLVAGTGISITPSGSNITIANTGSSSSGAAGSIQFSDGAGGFNSNATNLFWDNTNHYIGIGTNTPADPIEIVTGTAATNQRMRVTNYWQTNTAITAAPGVIARASRGTLASPLTVQSGDQLAVFAGSGHDGTAFAIQSPNITIIAGETFTTSAHGSFMAFSTVPNGTTTVKQALQLNADQSMSLKNADGTFVNLKTQPSSTNYTLNLPLNQGTSGQVLTTNGASPATLTWTTSSGGGANTALSNLTSPTAINQDLIFSNVSNADSTIKGADISGNDAPSLFLLAGNSDSGNGGNLTISAGDGNTFAGNLTLSSGGGAGNPNTGVSIHTKTTGTGASAAINLYSDNATGSGNSGTYTVTTGNAVDGQSGSINFQIGSISGTGTRGTFRLDDGSSQAGYVLTATDTTGVCTWMASGGGGSPAGSNGDVQFNNSGSFGANPDFHWNDSLGAVKFGKATAGSISSTGSGSFAAGITTPSGSSELNASGDGSFAQGVGENGGAVVASGPGSFAQGYASGNGSGVRASGNFSFAHGYADSGGNITAAGGGSTAMGIITSSGAANIHATARAAFAGGAITDDTPGDNGDVLASGIASFAYGNNLTATGTYSHVTGVGNITTSYAVIAGGRYARDLTGSSSTWVSTDPLFVLGNGTAIGSEANAFLVLKDSTTTIGSTGTTPTHVLNTNSATGAQVGTFTNVPGAAGPKNPAGYIQMTINGTTSYIPYFQ